jgi:DNA-binding beta-propeller fold protein YncE
MAASYVTLPGRDGYPDWRVAIVDTAQRSVRHWVNLRPAGQTRGTRPVGIQVSPFNTAIYPRPYVVLLNEFANFASVIDTRTDAVIGEFQTDFYAQDLIFNANGTRLYLTDRFGDQVRAFAIGAGPSFTQIAAIRTGRTTWTARIPAISRSARTRHPIRGEHARPHDCCHQRERGCEHVGQDDVGRRSGYGCQSGWALGHRLGARDQ